jgi:hypothetical protein
MTMMAPFMVVVAGAFKTGFAVLLKPSPGWPRAPLVLHRGAVTWHG